MNNLLRLIGRRLVALPIMALGVTVLVFFLMSFSKTDPAYTALGDGASPEVSMGLSALFFTMCFAIFLAKGSSP